MKVLLVDIPTYSVTLCEQRKQLLLLRLKAEAEIQARRLGLTPKRPMRTYSRGLLIVAAGLKERGYDVKYIVYSDEKDRQRLLSFSQEADVLGITVLTPTVSLAADICRTAKAVNPSIICVIGGPHIKVLPEETLRLYSCFDVAVYGPGEIIFPDLISSLADPSRVPGIAFRKQGDDDTERSSEPLLPDNSAEVSPAYELLYRHLSEYAHNIRTQDGCPYNCDFCVDRCSWSGKRNVRTISSVISELAHLATFCEPITLIHFSDSIFCLDKSRALALCREMERFTDRFIFSVDLRADLLDYETVSSMVRANVQYFRLGFEDCHSEILNCVRKGILPATAIEAARLIREVSPKSVIHAYWVTGLPGTSKLSLIENALGISRLITEEVVDVVGNKIFVPYPGIPCYDSPEKYGIALLTKNWRYYDRLSFPVYRLDDLSEFEIYSGFLFSQSMQLQAYIDRLGAEPSFPIASLSDYGI